MNSPRHLSLALAVASLFFLGWLLFTRNGPVESSHTESADTGSFQSATATSSDSPSRRSAKTSDRPENSDKERRKRFHFQNFFLPPITFKEASLATALEAVRTSYRETAETTGDESYSLQFDLAQARSNRAITLTTPRAPVTTVIQLIAAFSGNKTSSKPPEFHFTAIQDSENRQAITWTAESYQRFIGQHWNNESNFPVTPAVPTAFVVEDTGIALEIAPSVGPADFVIDLMPDLQLLGLSPEADYTNKDGEIIFENLNSIDLAILRSLEDLSGHNAFTTQTTHSTQILQIPEGSLPHIDNSRFYSDAEIQLILREFAMLEGTQLLTAPKTLTRSGQPGQITIDPGSGSTMLQSSSSSHPLGLGSETNYNLQIAFPGSEAHSFIGGQAIPEGKSSMVRALQDDGTELILIQTLQRVDHEGKPIREN